MFGQDKRSQKTEEQKWRTLMLQLDWAIEMGRPLEYRDFDPILGTRALQYVISEVTQEYEDIHVPFPENVDNVDALDAGEAWYCMCEVLKQANEKREEKEKAALEELKEKSGKSEKGKDDEGGNGEDKQDGGKKLWVPEDRQMRDPNDK